MPTVHTIQELVYLLRTDFDNLLYKASGRLHEKATEINYQQHSKTITINIPKILNDHLKIQTICEIMENEFSISFGTHRTQFLIDQKTEIDKDIIVIFLPYHVREYLDREDGIWE